MPRNRQITRPSPLRGRWLRGVRPAETDEGKSAGIYRSVEVEFSRCRNPHPPQAVPLPRRGEGLHAHPTLFAQPRIVVLQHIAGSIPFRNAPGTLWIRLWFCNPVGIVTLSRGAQHSVSLVFAQMREWFAAPSVRSFPSMPSDRVRRLSRRRAQARARSARRPCSSGGWMVTGTLLRGLDSGGFSPNRIRPVAFPLSGDHQ